MRVYWDTSALVALYVPDVHSAAADRQLARCAGTIVETPLHVLELGNAIALRLFRREIAPAAAAAARSAWRDDRQQGVLVPARWPQQAFVIAASSWAGRQNTKTARTTC